MPASPYLRRRDGRYYLRVRVPANLIRMLRFREITRSLETGDVHEARRRGTRAAAAVKVGFEIMSDMAARADLSAEKPEDLRQALKDFAGEDPFAVMDLQRRLLESKADMFKLTGELNHQLSQTMWSLEKQGHREEARAARDEAEQARTGQAEAEQAAASERQRAHALHHAVVNLSSAGVGAPVELHEGHASSVAELKGPFLEAKKFSSTTLASYDKAFERFEEVVGDKPIGEITRNDVVRYVETMEQTRSDKRGRDALKPATTQKYLSHIREFFGTQLSKNRVRANPAANVGVTRTASGADHEQRDPFTPDQMRRLLQAPIFRGCKSYARITKPGTYQCRDGRFWYGLVKIFTGARNAEVEELTIDDVVYHCGAWHIEVNKRHKTKAGARLIPIHSNLLKIGFLDWVAKRRRTSDDGKLFEKRKYGRIWNEKILPAAGVKTDKTCIYSFRHNFDDGLKEIVQDKTRHRLMGHEGDDMGSRYGNGTVTRSQVEAIERLDLGDLDFSFLFNYETVEDAYRHGRIDR